MYRFVAISYLISKKNAVVDADPQRWSKNESLRCYVLVLARVGAMDLLIRTLSDLPDLRRTGQALHSPEASGRSSVRNLSNQASVRSVSSFAACQPLP